VNAAIYYHPDGFDTSRPKLMGRHAAGEAFLNAMAAHPTVPALWCYATSRALYQDFRRRVEATGSKKPTNWIPYGKLERLAEPGCLFQPGPLIGAAAWERRFGDPRAFSICGITHTIASHAVMDAIGDLLVAPLQPWDALICTSHAVKASIRRVLADWSEYLAERTGGRPELTAELPVIPLGIDSAGFEASEETAAYRARFRQRNGIADADVAFLFMGRLSYHAKANPLPMFLALERAAAQTRRKLFLILAGWFSNDVARKAFVDAVRALCPSVKVILVDGRERRVRRNVWHAADVFTSLSDNVQETFGLTPLEAMAAGLPVVATDWNGYRDTVRDGVDGFLVPTVMPPAGAGQLFAARHMMGIDSYDRYIEQASKCTAVDVDAAATAYVRLAGDAALRRTLGQAGQRRAREAFNWSSVVDSYLVLWSELEARRRAANIIAPRGRQAPAHPLRADPFRVFAAYPTTVLRAASVISLSSAAAAATIQAMHKLAIARPMRETILSEPEMAKLIESLSNNGPMPIAVLTRLYPATRHAALFRTVVWLKKIAAITAEDSQSIQ
jgi:alpha-maltose-1-phosphate synthase